ncbi:efflux transporter outer membrane subunit [Pseudomonas gingeri]|uniref:Efflux transporter outer membrane subunit n=1 Tax=Pseudomonas gingeri TaxID=117681 RepID=A0A7Y7XAY3_9PSED|nr:efflux transporter outer membrane subunit [Pseudomonas gingeri]NWB96250.1 efflux transporter outer membrane subunit [Pseudomonas gingeri]
MAKRSLLWPSSLYLVASLGLGACSLAPELKVPKTPEPGQFHTQGPWTLATPDDQASREGWWRIYKDPQLDAMQQQLLTSNPDLSAALAHYLQAQAYVAQAQSGLFPKIEAIGSGQRLRQSDTRPLRSATSPNVYDSATLGVEVDYEVDLWGRVRDTVAAGVSEAQASQADLALVRLSLQAQLTDSYIHLRGLDWQNQLLSETRDAYTKALSLTEGLHGGGIVSGLDVARARTQLSSVKSQLSQNRVQRALIEHGIAAMLGESASTYAIATNTAPIALPSVPTGLPSTLLQRRPDIAAAERRIAAANARIGVAKAAWFPAITLSAQGGYQSDEFANLLTAPNLFWVIGPSLVANLFDGGARQAQVDIAKAATDEAAAKYRSVVLGAFEQVENNLSTIAGLDSALVDQRDAAAAAQYSEDLSLARYRQGAVAYLDVVTAQVASLEARRSVLDLQTQQLSANVGLIKALGGGWNITQLNGKPEVAVNQAAAGDAAASH